MKLLLYLLHTTADITNARKGHMPYLPKLWCIKNRK
jgi:hypothetical protein